MHFAILTQYYPPEIGAPQARLAEIANYLVQDGHQVTVLTAMPNYPAGKIHQGYGGLLKREEKDGTQIIRTFIYPTQKADMLHRLANYFSFVFSSAFFGTFLLKRPDYLLVESPPLFLGLTSFWLSRIKRTKMIFNVSDLWPESAVSLGVIRRGSLSYKISAWLESFSYKRAWLVSGQSRTILADINARFPEVRSYHLSNGVDTEMFSPARNSISAREELALGSECVVFYGGLHGLAQGLDQVIDAAQILKDIQGLCFVLVGDGPEKQKLMAQAKSDGVTSVRFLDSRPKPQIPELVASADIIVVPLKMFIPGAVPSKLYEAMASGKPVVLVASGEAAEIVQQHNAGIVVEPGDVEGFAKAIKTLYEQPALRAEMGNNGRKAVKEHFDRSRIAARFIAYLEENLK
ncbi:MAG: glycosyltransferase family 4 protein [Pseudomonadales bacterium]|nr:glycosyltransferase family 4 protein [Pseudomonadales bacterium]